MFAKMSKIKSNPVSYTVEIDEDACVGCGSCAKVCVAKVIEVKEKATLVHPDFCIGCTQCTAVCPTRAIHGIKRPNAAAEQPEPVPTEDFGDKNPFMPFEDLARHMAARRSIRRFKDEIPSRELLEKLLQAVRYAPTGCNARRLKYVMMCDPERLKGFREVCSKLIAKPDTLAPGPCVLLVIGTGVCDDDPVIAVTHVDLLARSLGLGCTFAGFIEMCVKQSEDVRAYLRDVCGVKDIEDSTVCALYLGFPAEDCTFLRPAVRDPTDIIWT